jgi:pimeloyl-ACP methyl ester carboxylesterase
MARKLERAPVTREGGVPRSYWMIRDVAMHKLGVGTMRSMRSVVTGLFLPSLAFPEYTLTEKYHFWAAKAKSGIATLWSEVLATDLVETAAELEVPTYFLHGAFDYTCSYPLARKYLEAIRAPVKGFYTFDRSAHSPIFEEPDRVREILVSDVLRGRADLADR